MIAQNCIKSPFKTATL